MAKAEENIYSKGREGGRDKDTNIGIMPRIDTDEKITKLLDWLMQTRKFQPKARFWRRF